MIAAAAFACALLAAGCSGKSAQAQFGSGAGAGPAVPASVVSTDWNRFDYDAARSGVGPASTGITAADVKRLRPRVVRIDGTADSSAIELHAVRVRGRRRDVFFLTTTYGKTIALDARTGRRLWEFVPSSIRSYDGTRQITTATPIADPNRRYLYASSPDGMVHKLSVSSGRQVRSRHWPARVTFDAHKEKIASALNINGASVIVTTGGYIGDAPTYQGHVVAINRSSGRITGVWNSLCSNLHHLINPPTRCSASDSAIWARAGAVVEPWSGRMLVATGNAPFDGRTNWGDSVLELSADGRRLLHNWTPSDEAQLNANDTDLGSTAPALLPVFHGRHLAVQGGKDGQLHLLDIGRLDGTTGPAGPRKGGELQNIAVPGGAEVFSAPAVWSHNGRTYVFVGVSGSTAAYVLGSNGRLSLAWQDGSSGTSPVIAGGLLYVYDMNAGRLNIRRPTTGGLVASLPAAAGHWNSPIVVGGRIALPVGNANDASRSGVMYMWHLPGR
jgi:outer membrane protein assembly factor BamB